MSLTQVMKNYYTKKKCARACTYLLGTRLPFTVQTETENLNAKNDFKRLTI